MFDIHEIPIERLTLFTFAFLCFSKHLLLIICHNTIISLSYRDEKLLHTLELEVLYFRTGSVVWRPFNSGD